MSFVSESPSEIFLISGFQLSLRRFRVSTCTQRFAAARWHSKRTDVLPRVTVLLPTSAPRWKFPKTPTRGEPSETLRGRSQKNSDPLCS